MGALALTGAWFWSLLSDLAFVDRWGWLIRLAPLVGTAFVGGLELVWLVTVVKRVRARLRGKRRRRANRAYFEE